MTRLATHVWIGAYLRRLSMEGVFAHVVHRGDETAGAVAVKCADMGGQASLFTRNYGWEGHLSWDAVLTDEPEADVDAVIARERARDPDLWVVEIEDPRGRHLLGAIGDEGT